jgi:hypothetical protein
MLIYALSDAKVVLYLFEIFIGLYLYLNSFNIKYLFSDNINKDFDNLLENNNNNEGNSFNNSILNIKEFTLYFETVIKKMKTNNLDDKNENSNSLIKLRSKKEKDKYNQKEKDKNCYKSKLVKAFEFLKPFNIIMESELHSLEIIKLKIINDYKKLNISYKD